MLSGSPLSYVVIGGRANWREFCCEDGQSVAAHRSYMWMGICPAARYVIWLGVCAELEVALYFG
jgi:hypothetical protein